MRKWPRRAATDRAGSSICWPNDRRLVESFVGRAESTGYSAIVLTVDTFIPGWKPRDLQQGWLPFLQGMGNANFFMDPVFRADLEQSPEEDMGAATGHFLSVYVNPSLTWDDLDWLRELTSLPILVKGIQHVDDARQAARRGLVGIVVSNHGGRQVDGQSPRWTRCRRSPRPLEANLRSSSTAVSAAAAT